jgi:hypothetical protein
MGLVEQRAPAPALPENVPVGPLNGERTASPIHSHIVAPGEVALLSSIDAVMVGSEQRT